MIELIESEDATGVSQKIDTAVSAVTIATGEVSRVEAGLSDLEQRFRGVIYDVATTEGFDAAKAARKEIRDVRYRVQNLVEDTTKPLNALKSAIKTAGDEIIARIRQTEDPIDAQIKAEEDRKAAIKAEKERVAREAALVIERKLDTLRPTWPSHGQQITASHADLQISLISAIEVTIEEFGERTGEALQLQAESLAALKQAKEAAVAHELAQKAIEAERAELERQKAELQASREALEDMQRKVQAAQDELRAAAQREEAARNAQALAEQAQLQEQHQEQLRQQRIEEALVRQRDTRIAEAGKSLLNVALAFRESISAGVTVTTCDLSDLLDAVIFEATGE